MKSFINLHDYPRNFWITATLKVPYCFTCSFAHHVFEYFHLISILSQETQTFCYKISKSGKRAKHGNEASTNAGKFYLRSSDLFMCILRKNNISVYLENKIFLR